MIALGLHGDGAFGRALCFTCSPWLPLAFAGRRPVASIRVV